MYYSDIIINQIASDKVLAQKLEDALSGVEEQVLEQASRIHDGATRMIYYTSCLTENYQDVCSKLKREDVRFFEALYQPALLQPSHSLWVSQRPFALALVSTQQFLIE